MTIWTNSNRPDHRESGNYGPCRAAACQGCSFATPPALALTAPTRVTEDERDCVTLHTEPPVTFSGWSAFYRAVRCELGMVRRDEHGWHYPAYPVADHA